MAVINHQEEPHPSSSSVNAFQDDDRPLEEGPTVEDSADHSSRPISEAGSVRASIGSSADSADEEIPWQSPPFDRRVGYGTRRTGYARMTQAVLDSDTESDDVPPQKEPCDVLYVVTVEDIYSDKTLYRPTPFSGIDFKLFDSSPPNANDQGAIIHMCVRVNTAGTFKGKGNTVKNWWHKRADAQFDEKVKVEKVYDHTLEIKSARLRKALELVIDYDPDLFSRGFESFYLPPDVECFESLLMHFPDLKEHCDQSVQSLTDIKEREAASLLLKDPYISQMNVLAPAFGRVDFPLEPFDFQTISEVAVLLRLLGPQYQQKVVPTWKKLQESEPRIDYESLWLLYRPGTLVYKVVDHALVALVVMSAKDVVGNPTAEVAVDRLHRYEICAWSLLYNGRLIRRQNSITAIEKFDGDRPVMSLPLIPAVFQDVLDGGKDRESLRARGVKFLELVKNVSAHRNFQHPRSSYKGQIIVDHTVYRENLLRQMRIQPSQAWTEFDRTFEEQEIFPSDRATRFFNTEVDPDDGRGYRRFRGYRDIDARDPDQLGAIPSQAGILLPPQIGGVALATKKWMMFELDGISDKEPWESQKHLQRFLVIAKEDEEILRTVQPKGSREESVRADFIPGKGQGQVFLLHGPPGTGKTLTAECVANDTHRPLISLTPSDIEGMGRVEQTLRIWFNLASKWGAILLIDEADIFLEKRQAGAAGHNSYVTIFLRTMEYYEGILFLTTNRPGKIDDSFISRTTASIQYPKLNAEARYQIWLKFYDMYERANPVKIKITSEAKTRIRKDDTELNGREIRNVLQLAIRLASLEASERAKEDSLELDEEEAKREKPPKILWVDWDHISKALDRQKAFKTYLNGLNRNMSEEKRNAFSGNY